MWKPEHRLAADRRGLRYPSELLGNKTRLARPIGYFEPRGSKLGPIFGCGRRHATADARLFERGDRSQVASRDRVFQGLG
jgi:hypothetical protein